MQTKIRIIVEPAFNFMLSSHLIENTVWVYVKITTSEKDHSQQEITHLSTRDHKNYIYFFNQ